MKTLLVGVEGMHCGGCAKKITEHFSNVAEVESVDVNLDNKEVKIVAADELSNMGIRNDIIELGFTVTGIQKS